VRARGGRALAGSEEAADPDRGIDLREATESDARVKVRRAQAYFRRVVLSNYRGRCCITGLPVRALLTASHIVPWSVDELQRINPRNGLCLARTQDAAFDRGLITLDEERRLLVGSRLRRRFSHPAVRENFAAFEGRPIRDPEKHRPDERFLAWHRAHRFEG
jgi:predicted restriction endonuclease